MKTRVLAGLALLTAVPFLAPTSQAVLIGECENGTLMQVCADLESTPNGPCQELAANLWKCPYRSTWHASSFGGLLVAVQWVYEDDLGPVPGACSYDGVVQAHCDGGGTRNANEIVQGDCKEFPVRLDVVADQGSLSVVAPFVSIDTSTEHHEIHLPTSIRLGPHC